MARKTTSGSGFHFIFEMHVPNLIEKDINIDEVRYANDFLRYLRANFDEFKNYANELRSLWNKSFYDIL